MILLKKILSVINKNKDFVFVSVGANDGIFVDEIFQSKLLDVNWDSHFIEPIKERFDLLVKNYDYYYPNNNFKYYNYAIHINEGEDFLITNKVDDSRGMCSFFRHENPHTERIKVIKKTFLSFIKESNISKIDFLKIDCEGMDYEIILQCFDCGVLPDLILFESIILDNSMVRGEKELNEFIKKSEYIIINDTPEFQYEEHNKLLIKKELLSHV
jgi:FkbM family methyltransferase